MSHNASLGSPPHVLSVSPAAFIATGSQTLTINGNNLSTSCRLSIPADLGTVVGAPTYTAGSGAQGDLAFTIDVAAIPGTTTNRVLTLSNGGHASTGVTAQVYHGWTPQMLITSVDDGWFRASELSAVGDGNNVSTWDPSTEPAITSTLAGFYQGTGTAQPFYRAACAGLDGKPAVIFGFEDVLETVGQSATELYATAAGVDGWDQAGHLNAGSIAMAMSTTAWSAVETPGNAHVSATRGSATSSTGRSNNLSGIRSDGSVNSQNNNSTGISSAGPYSRTPGLHVLILTWPGDTTTATVSLYVDSDTPVATGTAGATKTHTGKGILRQYGAIGEVIFLHGTQMTDADAAQLRAYWRGVYE